MRKFVIFILLMIFGIPVSAQESGPVTFVSDDGAVQFSYPTDWTIESQVTTFNQLYSYDLWTHSSAMAPYFGNEDRSRILIKLVNPRTAGYPANLILPLDYANYALEGLVLESTNIEVAGYPAVRVVPTLPAMPTPQPLTMSENFGPPVEVTPFGAGELNHGGVFYAVVRDDNWLVLANLAAPRAEIQGAEAVVLQLLESLVFDAQAAAIPFERDLPLYDVSSVHLTGTFTNDDGIFSLQYPTDWGTADYRTVGDPAVRYAVIFAAANDTAQMIVMVFDVTSSQIGLPLDLNEPEEFMRAARDSSDAIIGPVSLVNKSEFRLGEFDAVSLITDEDDKVRQVIYFPLNDSWIAAGYIQAETVEGTSQYEAAMVAVLGSLRFALGDSFISSPALQVTLPDEWVYHFSQQQDNYYEFLLRPNGAKDPRSARIRIQLASIGGTELFETITAKGLIAGLEQLASSEAVFENDPESLTIGDRQIAHVEASLTATGEYVEYNLLMVNKTWLMLITGEAFSIEEARETIPSTNRIIEQAVITLSAE